RIARAIVDVLGRSTRAEAREIEKVARPREIRRELRPEDARHFGVHQVADAVAALARDEGQIGVAGQLAVEREEAAEGVVVGGADARRGAPAAAAQADDRKQRPAVL